MDVFNKLYSQVSSSVSNTVSQLSGVLPGNPVTREYDCSTHIASAGPGLMWKVYKGSKRSTKEEAAIFVFEKRQLEKWTKNEKDVILESLRRGIQQLTKIRHPQVLTVQHPLEESRESIAFATEPIFASLANVLGQTMNMPQPANMSDYKFFELEIKYGLLQVGEGLAFLHNDCKLIHKNICPESIVINASGVWKIFGFDYCVINTNPPNEAPRYPFLSYTSAIPAVCQPNLNYLAPECIISQSHSEASDMFSLGMLAYVVHSPNNRCFTNIKEVHQMKSRNQELSRLSSTKLMELPQELREVVRLLLSIPPEARLDAHQFVKIPFFDDVGVKTLTYLDSLLQWDNLQKSQFYKGLPEVLSKLPHRVKVQRVLSCLVRDLKQPTMVPFVLPNILIIAENCTKQEYCVYILPYLKPLMKLMEPIQIMLIMLQKMELLLKLTPAEDIQLHVLPMLYRGLDCDMVQIHEMCLAILPTFASLLDHSNVKNSLLPRIKKLCLSTSSLSVRVNCLLCVGKLLEHLDKWLVLDEILPFLPQIPSREPAVLMGILGIYKIAMTHKKLGITKEIMATRILPFLIPLCIENGLTLAQFGALVTLVKDMIQVVETEHRIKLEQLNSVKDEQKMLTMQMPKLETSVQEFLNPSSSKQDSTPANNTSMDLLSDNWPSADQKKEKESRSVQWDQSSATMGSSNLPLSQKSGSRSGSSNEMLENLINKNLTLSNPTPVTSAAANWASPSLGHRISFPPAGNPLPPQQNWSTIDNTFSLDVYNSNLPTGPLRPNILTPAPSTGNSHNINNQLTSQDLLDFLN
ncbi:SCY1-like protein 2 [Cylas formicarius]|uniref:SCY1-like protein 2 n=1 Tax=Cylas formicarius TaxID=197179 RepID=UPI002958D0DD|nr:SCY1-like protein 2 [Cylas formicarius]